MRKKKIYIIIAVLLVLSIGYSIGVYRINSKFKQVKIKEIPLGVQYQVNNDIWMKVNGVMFLDKEELEKTYEYRHEYEGEIIGILVESTYLNKGDEKQIVTTYNNNIERTGYSNGIDPILFSRLNLCDLNFELDGGEEKDIVLTYILMDFQFNNKRWENIENGGFYISSSRYPIKTKWLLR